MTEFPKEKPAARSSIRDVDCGLTQVCPERQCILTYVCICVAAYSDKTSRK